MTYQTPERRARANIDSLLEQVGWELQNADSINLHTANSGVAVREFPLKSGHGTADYLLFVDRKAVGVVEAKPEGHTLTGVESQSGKYSTGLPDSISVPRRPLPFLYESTGIETQFTNLIDPIPRSRSTFAFHPPSTLSDWLRPQPSGLGVTQITGDGQIGNDFEWANLRHRLRSMPANNAPDLWPVQERAIRNLEESLAANRPRALVQMATGSGKTFMACNQAYRLIKHAGAKRLLFLVDRSNLARQTLREFQAFTAPDDVRKFDEIYPVQLLDSGSIDPVSRVCISTVQRVYSMLKGDHLDPELEEMSGFDMPSLRNEPAPVAYNPQFPIDTFDFIITDECHRSIYNLWRQVLEYFDAFLIGLTATPSKQTFGFFQQNLVMEYNHEQAVADGINVDFDVYRIRTQITEEGSNIDAGFYVDRRDRRTRKVRWEQLEDDLEYAPGQLDTEVVAEDQIRTVIQAFRDGLFTEMFPGRREVPKTIIFAKDDSHADDIVRIVRQEFDRGNDFCQKITYRTTGAKPEELLAAFRIGYSPRIVVTVDMIATGTDIKPVEIVIFMRNVRSRIFFEQMKGRGVRTILPTDFEAVTPDAKNKDRFVIVDVVGVTETELSDTYTLERQRSVPFDKLLDLIAVDVIDVEVLSSLASRFTRLDRKLSAQERQAITRAARGKTLQDLVGEIVRAIDPDVALEVARASTGLDDPAPSDIVKAQQELLKNAALPLADNPELRQLLIGIHRAYEQTIDTVNADELISAGFSQDGEERARKLVQSFQQFIQDNRDEITALQVLYERPYRDRLRYSDIRALADAIESPPRSWTTDQLWNAYQTLDGSRVRGSGQRMLSDIVSLVRYAVGEADKLTPFADTVSERFEAWIAAQQTSGRSFNGEQLRWLEAIRDHIVGSVCIEMSDLELAPFNQQGGLMRAYAIFGDELESILDELNLELAA